VTKYLFDHLYPLMITSGEPTYYSVKVAVRRTSLQAWFYDLKVETYIRMVPLEIEYSGGDYVMFQEFLISWTPSRIINGRVSLNTSVEVGLYASAVVALYDVSFVRTDYLRCKGVTGNRNIFEFELLVDFFS